MIGPLPSTPSCNRRNGTAFCALWRPFVAARSRSPSIQKCSELKPPRTSRNGQHPTFQTVPAATALSFLPLEFLQKCAPVATLAMLDAGFCPLSTARRTDVLVLSFSAFDQSGPSWRWPSRLVATAEEDRLSFHTSFAAASDCRNNCYL